MIRPVTCRGLNDTGVSGAIGAIFLIILVVAGMGILMVAVISQPQQQKIPVITADVIITGNDLYLKHNGGDTLQKGEFQILVDGQDKTAAFGDPTTWSIGQTLTYSGYDPQNIPGTIQIVYTGGRYGQTIEQLWVKPPTLTSSPTQTTSTTTTSTTTATPTPVPAPVANFTGTPLTGATPLTVQFTDRSTNSPTSWVWNFGDGNFTGNTTQNPTHIYTSVGTYTVTLNATNAAGSNTFSRTNYIQTTISNFTTFIIQNNVFVYGTQLNFAGNSVYGPGATIVITGPLYSSTLNGGAYVAVTTIYVDGDVTLNSGSASLGSSSNPGAIYVNGNMNLNGGSRDIYGDVHIAKSLSLQNCRIHGNMYVNGDLTLDWGVPTIDDGDYIYYTGTLTAPAYYDTTFLLKCKKVATVPGFSMPNQTIAPVKTADWYAARGYVSGGSLTSNMKIYSTSGYSYSYSYSSGGSNPANNVIIIAGNGDISLTGYGGGGVTGVLYAPNGKVTFDGGSFTGVVIASNGFYVTSGGTTVTFTNLANYFSSPDDYPF